jgi:hypothetical protein
MFAYKYTKQFTYVSWWSLVFFAHLYDFCVFSTMVNHLFEYGPTALILQNLALYKVVMVLLTTMTMPLVVMVLLTTTMMTLVVWVVGLYTCVQEYLPDLIAIYVLS